MIDTLKIGGKDIEIRIRYFDVQKFLKKFNRVYGLAQEKTAIIIPNDYFIDVLWELICIDGKRPFKNKKKLTMEILQGEYQGIVNLISVRILKMKPVHYESDIIPVVQEDKEEGNLQDGLN